MKILLSSKLETGSSMKKWLDCSSAHPSTSKRARKKHQTNMRSSPLEILIGGCAMSGFGFGIKNEIDSIPFEGSCSCSLSSKPNFGLYAFNLSRTLSSVSEV